MFIISAELYAFGSLIYLILGSGRKQYWADPIDTEGSSITSKSVVTKSSAPRYGSCEINQKESFTVPKLIPSEKTNLTLQNHSDDYVLVNY